MKKRNQILGVFLALLMSCVVTVDAHAADMSDSKVQMIEDGSETLEPQMDNDMQDVTATKTIGKAKYRFYAYTNLPGNFAEAGLDYTITSYTTTDASEISRIKSMTKTLKISNSTVTWSNLTTSSFNGSKNCTTASGTLIKQSITKVYPLYASSTETFTCTDGSWITSTSVTRL